MRKKSSVQTPKLFNIIIKTSTTNVKPALVPSITTLLQDKYLVPHSILSTCPRPLTGTNAKLLVSETENIFCSAWPTDKRLLVESTHSLLQYQTFHSAFVYYQRCKHCVEHPCSTCPLNLATILGFQTHYDKETWTPQKLAEFKSLPMTKRYPKRILLNDLCDARGDMSSQQYLILLQEPIPVKRSALDFNTSNMHLQNQDEVAPQILKMLKNVAEKNE